MRPLVTFLVLAVTFTESTVAQAPPRREIDNVAAFTRLYGVVRYFYPSDAAAALDWNRFAVHGVRQVRRTEDPKALATTLNALFSPLGPELQIGTSLPPAPSEGAPDKSLIAWHYLGPGFSGSGVPGPYRSQRTNRARSSEASIDGFVTMMQSIPAQTLRGKAVRLRGQARAAVPGTAGSGALWLRVDRPNQTTGFFDNMGDRPIREAEWREYAIEGTVADDATELAFGVMASGRATADFDRIELSVRGEGETWTPIQIEDAGFEGAADARGWFRAGTSTTAVVVRPSGEAAEGRQFLRFAPGSSAAGAGAELFADAPPRAGAHVDIDLGSGLKARVPLALSDVEATVVPRPQELDALRAYVTQVREAGVEPDADVALADVVVAWNVFRHFYPYWTEAAVDWDDRLRPQLEYALGANTRRAHHDALRRLVADARDGHGVVRDMRQKEQRGALPVALGVVEQRVVITASSAAAAPVGAVVSAIDGVPADGRLAEIMRLHSGTTQWKQVGALREMSSCSKGAVMTLVIDAGAGTAETKLPCDAAQPPTEKRPDPVSELSPGIWYVDLTRARGAQVKPILERLSGAAGVVFDVRGYPTDAGAQILPHLADAPEQDRWMHVPKIAGPFGQFAGWQSVGWNLTPATPHLGGRVVFLTDGRAISYAESVMGYVADRKLGRIVGAPTAGTNGNVAVFDLPGGFRVSFTGMRVTRHDGQSPHHLIGVQPDVAMAPTVASIREGRDVVLERAVELARAK